MPIPDDSIFACLALDGPFVWPRGDAVIDSGPVSVHRTAPVELDDFWRESRGTVLIRQLDESQFTILATQPYCAENQGHAQEELLDILFKFHNGLLLQGTGYSHGGLEVSGATQGGQLSVNSVNTVLPRPVLSYRQAGRITRAVIDRASALVPVIRGMYRYPRRYIRLRRGLLAWEHGIQSTAVDERLHDFVRATEAITKPGRSGMTRTFADRGQLFIGSGSRKKSLLCELYHLRSVIEHVKKWRRELSVPRGVPRDRAFALRAFQAEMIASHIYIRIFESPILMRSLATEPQFNRFWNSPESDRRNLWGEPVNLRQEQDRWFIY